MLVLCDVIVNPLDKKHKSIRTLGDSIKRFASRDSSVKAIVEGEPWALYVYGNRLVRGMSSEHLTNKCGSVD
ncbi:hypothetical protein V1477_006155 [Vespula maculifrons]|uniref:Uncharacterized protein n=1 Tax=Vespula maculifrons TaxID=7453 RepID=A0ABD2CKP5_VESMC